MAAMSTYRQQRTLTPSTARTIVITVPRSGVGGGISLTGTPVSLVRSNKTALLTAQQTPTIGTKRVAPPSIIDPLICQQTARKRERLTHLTPEEKLNRRKLKNRVAAQTARDRKKLRTCKLEDALKRLAQQNADLMKENARLTSKLDEVIAENSRLQQQQQSQKEQYPPMQSKTEDRSPFAFGSAASINAPLQRDQANSGRSPTPTHRLLLTLLAYLIPIYSRSSTICSAEQSLTNLTKLTKIRSTLWTSNTISREQMNTIITLWKARKRTSHCPSAVIR
jgi:hypothetical protein